MEGLLDLLDHDITAIIDRSQKHNIIIETKTASKLAPQSRVNTVCSRSASINERCVSGSDFCKRIFLNVKLSSSNDWTLVGDTATGRLRHVVLGAEVSDSD